MPIGGSFGTEIVNKELISRHEDFMAIQCYFGGDAGVQWGA